MSGENLRANPYVGLRPFFGDDSLYFFGREQQTAELLEILRQHRFLGVVGSSGSGKSSLVRAGLLPGLLGGFLVQERDRWRTVQMKPGDAPLGNLARELIKAMGEETRETAGEAAGKLEQDIREDHTGAVVEFLTTRLERNTNLFLLVDQFEEIFDFRGSELEEEQQSEDLARRKDRARRKAEAADFVDLMLALAEQRDLPIYVTLTMRTDFLGDCDLFYGLPEALNRGRYLVPRMTREQLRNAVECPGLLLRAQMAPRLLDHLLNELGDRFDRLPVLQHALLRTWDEWQRTGGVGPIDLRHYESSGRLESALDQDAEVALQGLDMGVTARVFKRLTDTDLSQRRVRSPARISELMTAASADRGTVEGIVRRFEENSRSFVHRSADGKADDPRVDISHESLIRQWNRLRNWVDEERRSRDDYRELVKKARKWERGQAAPLQDPELKMAVDWKEKVSPSPGWAQRYSVSDGDFDSAVRYLDESVEVRCRNLAEVELRRSWESTWSPLILAMEVVVGVWFAQFTGFLTLIQNVDAAWKADGFRGVGFWPVVWNSILSTESFGMAFFLLTCVGLNLYAKQVHRKFALSKILRGVVLRPPIEVADLRDAVVALDTTYGSIFRRVGGYFVDVVLLFVFSIASILPLGIFLAILDAFIPGAEEIVLAEENEQTLGLVWVVLILVISWLYSTLQITSKRQATVGMRAVGIVMTDLHGKPLSFPRASAWYGYRLLSYLYLLGFIIQPFTPKRQTFHDWMAKTVVLRRPLPESAPPAPELASDGRGVTASHSTKNLSPKYA